eukprot:TRINITY_DN6906_c0_g1_i3.p1 TRINITY_DN6906_c0_g1~~TRINITY_DN6906_c0_g1_i3.p1  ORF type:complete len:914 (+),score=122.80 TRINITY_DN6906_c0_g1_i3:223-2742(+)
MEKGHSGNTSKRKDPLPELVCLPKPPAEIPPQLETPSSSSVGGKLRAAAIPVSQEGKAVGLDGVCVGCGSKFMPDARFCRQCGKSRTFQEETWDGRMRNLKIAHMKETMAQFISQESELYHGDEVRVIQTFFSDSRKPCKLVKGSRGVVVQKDRHGDVLLEMYDSTFEETQWVFSSQQGYLTKVKLERSDADTNKVSSRRSRSFLMKRRGAKSMKGSRLHRALEAIIGFMVVANTVVVGARVEYGNEYVWLIGVDMTFTVVFFLEFLFRLYMFGPKDFFLGMNWLTNNFDFVIIIADFLQLVMTFALSQSPDEMKAISILRSVRLLHLIDFVQDYMGEDKLQAVAQIVEGVKDGTPALTWSFSILATLIYLVAVACRLFFASPSGDSIEEVEVARSFESLPQACLTIFRCSFGDCSTPGDGLPLPPIFMEVYGSVYGIAYAVFFFTVTVGIFNVISAIFVDGMANASKARETGEKLRQFHDEQLLAAWTAVLIGRISTILQQISVKHLSDNGDGVYEQVPAEIVTVFEQGDSHEQQINKQRALHDFHSSRPHASFKVKDASQIYFEEVDFAKVAQCFPQDGHDSFLPLHILASDETPLVVFKKTHFEDDPMVESFIYRYTHNTDGQENEMWYIGPRVPRQGSEPPETWARAPNEGAQTRPPPGGWEIPFEEDGNLLWEEAARDLVDLYSHVPQHGEARRKRNFRDPWRKFFPSRDLLQDALEACKTLTQSDTIKKLDPLTMEDFQALMQDETATAALEALGIHSLDIAQLPDILDAENDFEIRMEEIVGGLRHLRGDPTRGDVITVDLMTRDIQSRLNALAPSIHELLGKQSTDSWKSH